MKKIQFTQDGYDNLKKEYEELVQIKKPAAVERLSKARAMGDLSENSEYTAAKEDLVFVDGRTRELEEVLKNAEIISGHTSTNVVEIGNTIVVEQNGEKDTFMIVGEFEADPQQKKLSHTSPIGKALLGKRIGDKIEVTVPVGTITYKITEIKRS